MLTVQDLRVSYGTATILDGVSASLEAGQWLMLAGPNGAGKSTLVSAISNGAPYTGTVLLHGKDIKTYPAGVFAQKIGVLAQNNSINYSFTVEEVVRLGRYAWSRGPFAAHSDEDAQMVETALAQTGMGPLRDHSMLTLSGGEMQRAFLAQVLAQNPEILVLDEPANHLDLVYQSQMYDILTGWVKQPGRAILSVVHDLSVARAYGTHALLLHKGKAVAFGTAAEALSPENLNKVYSIDVAGWMRSMLAQWR